MGPGASRRRLTTTVGALLAGALVLAACTESEDAETTPEPRETITETSSRAPLVEALDGVGAPSSTAALDLAPLPAPEAIFAALTESDWLEVFAEDNARAIRRRLIELAIRRATEGNQGEALGDADVRGERIALRTGSARGVLRRAQVETTTKHEDSTFSDGTRSGSTSETLEEEFDSETARQTITLTIEGESFDSATGEPRSLLMVMRWEHDLCWSEGGTRTGEYETTTTVTVTTGDDTTSSSESRHAGAAYDGDGRPTYTWGSTVDGNSATATGTDPGAMGPGGESSTSSSSTGEVETANAEWENGFEMEGSASGADYDEEAIGEILDEVVDYENFREELAFAQPPDPVNEGPGSVDYCLRTSLDPESASLLPDGETLGLTVTVRDWNEEPLQGALVETGPIQLGAFTGPTSSFSDHNGEFATLYTSAEPGTETIYIRVDYAGFDTVVEGVIEIGGGWSLAMSMDVEGVTFLWDGTFLVRGGRVIGSGIGTVVGSGRCVSTGSGGTYTGPLADAEGTFTFDVAGSHTAQDDGEWMTLQVRATEADVELSFEDPVCGAFVDIAKTFLNLVPTLPPQVYRDGFQVAIADGVGFADLAIDPYTLRVDVAELGE
jgi:hypothetical protein